MTLGDTRTPDPVAESHPQSDPTSHELWFSRPAASWGEALPLGNGRLGAMVFGGTTRERLQINDGTAWSGSPASESLAPRVTREAAATAIEEARAAVLAGDHVAAGEAVKRLQHRFTQSYLPFADLFIETGDAAAGDADTADAIEVATGAATGAAAADAAVTHAGYRRRLDLATATHETTSRRAGYTVVQRSRISAPHGILVVELSTDDPAGLDLSIELTSPLRVLGIAQPTADTVALRLKMPRTVDPSYDSSGDPVHYDDDDTLSMQGAVALRLLHDGTVAAGAAASGTNSDVTAAATPESPESPATPESLASPESPASAHLAATTVTRATILLTTATTFRGLGNDPSGTADDALAEAIGRLDTAVEAGVDTVIEAQERDHRSYYDRAAVETGAALDLPLDERLRRGVEQDAGSAGSDPGLAGLMYNFGRYLLISSSRPGGVPANLQGIWNDLLQPPWSGNYTTNINVQMNYWPAEVANLGTTAEPLFDLIELLAENGHETASRIYGTPGWVAHHNTDIWGFTQPVGFGRHDPAYAFWPFAGLWLVRHLWEHVVFGADDDFVRDRAWPVIHSAAEFALGWLTEAPDGTLGTVPSTSPENHFAQADGRTAAVSWSSTLDLTLIADTFRILDALSHRLGQSDATVDAARGALSRLPGPPIGPDGAIIEWRGDHPQTEPHHRHLSHLYFVFPGDSTVTPELATAAIASMDGRGDDATGWSLAWKLALRARLGQAGKVSDLLRLVFRPVSGTSVEFHSGGVYPNLLVAHPPFQIDGNFGYVAGLSECLLQSHAGRIDLLPALPAELASGTARGLVARPGVEVDLTWREGTLVQATLRATTSRASGCHVVSYRGGETTVELPSDGRPVAVPLTALAPV